MATSIELRPLRHGEAGGLSRLLWRAFERDPLFRYLFRSRPYAGRVVPLLFDAAVRDALRHGWIDVGVAGGQPVATAIWLSPGNVPSTGRRILARLPAYLLLGLLFLDRLPDLVRLTRVATSFADEPHWHLEYLGVDPDRQGQGVGGQLLAQGLLRADGAGVPCGLETSNERTVALYRRFGFQVREEARPFRIGPPVWTLWRPATAPRARAGPEPGAPGANPPIEPKGR